MDLYQIPITSIDGTPGTLASYRGQVLLIVNVASRCRFTSQYSGLELLYRRHRTAGLAVLGFPCNQFAGQEPGSEADILAFCLREYDISFPLFSKVEVNGPRTHPLYQHLKEAEAGPPDHADIEWNFTKFLIGRAGSILRRYSPKFSPGDMEPDVVRALGEPPSASTSESPTQDARACGDVRLPPDSVIP